MKKKDLVVLLMLLVVAFSPAISKAVLVGQDLADATLFLHHFDVPSGTPSMDTADYAQGNPAVVTSTGNTAIDAGQVKFGANAYHGQGAYTDVDKMPSSAFHQICRHSGYAE